MAAAYIRGIQENGVAACPKHFAVNSQELRRMAMDSVVDERTLREIYLTGFEIAVKEGKPRSIMSSYNKVNGTYANENAHLLKEILRDDWGFDGFVVTDWGADNDHALGVKNGSNLVMPAPGPDAAIGLVNAVKEGRVSEADLDERLKELFRVLVSADEAMKKAPKSFDKDAHHALARKCAEQSVVLLENDGCLTWGKTPADAAHLVEALDYYAAVTAKLGCAGCSKCGSCGGHCTGCSKCGAPAVQPMAQPAAQPVAMAVPSAQPAQPVSLPGVTGLIQPGMALPTLPKQQAAPAPAPVPAAQPAAVPAMEAAPAAPKSANARDAAMAEVIRRTLKSIQ